MNNISEVSRNICCGCSSCVQSCPHKCITIEEDSFGFIYPSVDESLCFECGRCLAVCPTINSRKQHICVQKAYAVKCKNPELVSESASGGMFAALANWIIAQNGVVFGAAFNESFDVEHKGVSNITSLFALKKSKYLHSKIGKCYTEALQYLNNGQWVFFSGTPCQIAGLKAFLGDKQYDKLVTAQIICHGVPSQSVWREYLLELETLYNAKLIDYDFRFKDKLEVDIPTGVENYGWKSPKVRALFSNAETYKIFFEKDVFTGGFAKNLYLRRSCYSCRWNYASVPDNSDFIIGDYYGIEKEHPYFNYEMGASAVIINSIKGEELLKNIRDSLDIVESSVDKIALRNTPLYTPSIAHNHRKEFFENFTEHNYTSISQLIRETLGYNFSKKVTFGVIGSYNSRWSVWNLLSGSDSELLFHYSNTSLISVVSSPAYLDIEAYPGNNFRKDMVKADLNKTLFTNILNGEFAMPDYLVFDLLEERFPVFYNGRSVFTKSDALMDSSVHISKEWSLMDKAFRRDAVDASWEKITEKLEKNGFPVIILIELYLCELYQTSEGNLVEFENIEEIRETNRDLAEYYNVIKSRHKNIIVIKLPKGDCWCKSNHRHGVLPCHLNDHAYEFITNTLFRIVEGNR